MQLAGLVLAGGRSSRMGRDKAELVLADQTLLERTVALLEKAGANRVYIAGRSDVRNALPDRQANAGPAVAALDAFRTIEADGFTHALIAPVDMPLLTLEALTALIGTQATATAYMTEPLPFFVNLKAASDVKTQPGSLHRLLSDLGAARIRKPDDDLIFVNANTPEDWDFIRKRLEQS